MLPYPSPAPNICVMYLLRHAATDNNLAIPPRLQGRNIDLALSEEGRRQAQRTADFLRDHPIQAVYSSPLKRALETGQIVAAANCLPVDTVEQIIEADVGSWEGRSWTDIAASDPEAYQRFMEDPGRHGYAGGENMLQVQQRVTPALQELMQRHLGQAIVVVGHNVVNRSFLARLLKVPIADARGISQDNCGINLIRLVDGQMRLKTTNFVFHL